MSIELRLALQDERAPELAERVRRLLGPFSGEESVVDVGSGTGALAFAFAPHVGEVVGIDTDEAYVVAARERAPANTRFVHGDATALPFGYAEFDIAATQRLLHHVRRPELVVSELARVTRPGGRVFVIDQLGSVDPLRTLEMDRFARALNASHERFLPDADIRGFLDANDLVLLASEVTRERVDLERRLELEEVPEEERERLRGLVRGRFYDIEVGWYVSRKSGP